MASTREEESRLQVRTLIIASAASLAAALITSRFWVQGTPIAAALTPVIVTIVSELLNRPTEAIARRVTTDRTAILPEATGAGPPDDQGEEPARAARDLEGEPAPVRVYRSERRSGWGRIHPKVVLVTAVLAFAIAAAALTLPELIAGESIGKGDRKTSLFGGRDRGNGDDEQQQPPDQTTPQQETEESPPPETVTEEQPAPTSEQPTPTTEEPSPTVPTVPEEAFRPFSPSSRRAPARTRSWLPPSRRLARWASPRARARARRIPAERSSPRGAGLASPEADSNT